MLVFCFKFLKFFLVLLGDSFTNSSYFFLQTHLPIPLALVPSTAYPLQGVVSVINLSLQLLAFQPEDLVFLV